MSCWLWGLTQEGTGSNNLFYKNILTEIIEFSETFRDISIVILFVISSKLAKLVKFDFALIWRNLEHVGAQI